MRVRTLGLTVAFIALLSGCAGGPGKTLHVHELMVADPAAVSTSEPVLDVVFVPARRYVGYDAAPPGKSVLVVPLTRVDGTAGPAVFGGLIGFPVNFAVKTPWVLTLQDGFLKIGLEPGRGIVATVEGSRSQAAPPLANESEIWIWIGKEPTEETPDPRGTFVGVRKP